MARTQQQQGKVPPRPAAGKGPVPPRPSARRNGSGAPRPNRAAPRVSARRVAQRQRNLYMAVGAVAVVVVVIGAILGAKYLGGSSPARTKGSLAPGEFALPAGVEAE